MDIYDKQTIIEIVLYVLDKTHGIDIYHLFKILYFAEQKHLVRYGEPMLADTFCALPNGPVPSALYDCIKDNRFSDVELQGMFNRNVSRCGEDASNILQANREPNMDFISEAAKESLDESISENIGLSFSQLRTKSHGEEWRRAFEGSGMRPMDSIGIAKDGNASEEMLEYLKENIAIDKALA